MIQWHFERIGTVLNKSENAGIVLNTVEKRKTEFESSYQFSDIPLQPKLHFQPNINSKQNQ